MAGVVSQALLLHLNPVERRGCKKKNPRVKASMKDDKLHEECGVVGVLQPQGKQTAGVVTCKALHSLQHRGEEGAGIVTYNGNSFQDVKGLGLVCKVFSDPTSLQDLQGISGLGHVRYGTAGSSCLENVQPFGTLLPNGKPLWVAHNGSIVNHKELKTLLQSKGYTFQSNSDSEVVLHLVSEHLKEATGSDMVDVLSSICSASEKLDGAFSLVFMMDNLLVAVRDPRGFRPLVTGIQDDGTIIFASETCALNSVGARYLREIEPGEVVMSHVTTDGSVSIERVHVMKPKEHKFCLLELFYLSRQDSIVFGQSVYEARYLLGELLAEDAPCECDFVMPIPDSAMVSLLGYAKKAGLPIHFGLTRLHYGVGRTFIQPKEVDRRSKVLMKFAPVKEIIHGKRIVVVDDSLVRGTTAAAIVQILRDAGAKEVHLRIPSPPVTNCCYYGVDIPSKDELLLSRMSIEEACKYLGVDSLVFLSLDRIKAKLKHGREFCDACFTGNHPC